MKYLFLTGAISLAATSLMSQNKIEFTEFDLENGMHVILHEDHSTPLVAVTMLYHVGSKNEDPDRTGFAHFFEHLLFEGSRNIDRHKFDKYVENAGGTLNANTSFDRTFYYVLMPSNQLELGMWLESERLLHAKVENMGIETQREVVKEEKRQRMDNQPYGSMLEEVFGHSFREHPYKWITIGSMEHLNAAQEEDYVGFYDKFYVPNNVTLSIAGDLSVDEAKELINKYFGQIPAGEKLVAYRDMFRMEKEAFLNKYFESASDIVKKDYETLKGEKFLNKHLPKLSAKPKEIDRPSIVEPPLGGEVRDTIYDEIQLPAVMQAYRIPEQGSDDYYAVSMLNSLLSDGASSRFTKKIVDEELKALFVGSFAMPLEDPGINLTMAVCGTGVQPHELEASIDREIELVKNELISEQEYQKLINNVENSFYSSNSTVAGIAESLANYHTYFGDANLINNEIERYKAVTREDIKRVANTYLKDENRVVLYYLPKEDK